VTDVIPIANFRTRLEAELAARLLEGADVPYVINSPEGMLHGPLGNGATILVRTEDVEFAREVLSTAEAVEPARVTRIVTCPTPEAATRVRDALQAAGIPALSTTLPGNPGHQRDTVFVPAAHAARARRVIRTAMLEP
jgi:hypothetical protein